ncbi:MAG TPA: MFS transporter [Acidobacteriota bacterium]|nr:MFS transporter [Acidobacteriota bacterium]
MATEIAAEQNEVKQFKIWQVIAASSAGTMIEWYDFYIFGSLGTIIAPLFYPPGDPRIQFLVLLATFATGFLVRPFGAVVFGRIGDLVGRKYAFLLTLLIMGGATTVIGLLPTYDQIGILAPIILVLLRLLQGLALGGEYGGAATYVAEHSPDHKRGYYTSYIQTTATLGLFLSLGVILVTRLTLGDAEFKAWGWRIPFLLSVLLVAMSYYIRLKLKESPLFASLKAAGKTSRQPLSETFRNPENRKLMILALLGATAGQAVVWYTGQFYALFFLQTALKVNFVTANVIVAIALVLGSPFFVVFGGLSDKIGRKKIMMFGCAIAALTYYPIYRGLAYFSGANLNTFMLTLLIFIQVIYVTMVYGPIAAYLVELFPTRIRYTSMSIPYHFGNGWFGGLTPFIATYIVTVTGNIFAGLLYPIAIALMTLIIGSIFLKDTSHVKLWEEIHK